MKKKTIKDMLVYLMISSFPNECLETVTRAYLLKSVGLYKEASKLLTSKAEMKGLEVPVCSFVAKQTLNFFP